MLSYWTGQIDDYITALTKLIYSLNEEIDVYERNSQKDTTQDQNDHATLKITKEHLLTGLTGLAKAYLCIQASPKDSEKVFKETQPNE